MSDLPAALLWDMDGLLVDSEPVWSIAETELYASWGRVWTEEVKAACMGRRLDTAVPIMIEYAGVDADPAAVSAWLLDRMVQLFAAALPWRPGALELLAETAELGIPQALVSSSYRVLVDAVAAVSGPWALTLAGDEVVRAKPDPEPYRTAAATLGVAPGECLVLEDSLSGARSGRDAGCAVIVVPSMAPVPADPGWTVLPSLTDVDLAAVRR
ncbi:MAG TPA: HAD family phosphatase [Frankiaceae bacterium]